MRPFYLFMFFLLSKILYCLILPFTWLFILLVCSAITKRKRLKIQLFRSAMILLILFSNPWLSNSALSMLETKPNLITEKYDVAIVLTGIIETGLSVENQTQLSEGADRISEAVRLLNQGVIKKILISGGAADIQNSEQNEGVELYKLAVALGVRSDQLIHENKSRNTHENALYTKELVEQEQFSSYLLVTSSYHMKRAKKCFEKQGINITPFPVDFRAQQQFRIDQLVPDSESFDNWNLVAKELTGIIVYSMMGYI